jgi:hypothetical protein
MEREAEVGDELERVSKDEVEAPSMDEIEAEGAVPLPDKEVRVVASPGCVGT